MDELGLLQGFLGPTANAAGLALLHTALRAHALRPQTS